MVRSEPLPISSNDCFAAITLVSDCCGFPDGDRTVADLLDSETAFEKAEQMDEEQKFDLDLPQLVFGLRTLGTTNTSQTQFLVDTLLGHHCISHQVQAKMLQLLSYGKRCCRVHGTLVVGCCTQNRSPSCCCCCWRLNQSTILTYALCPHRSL